MNASKQKAARAIEATSQTRWRDLPEDWQRIAVEAVVAAGWGDTEMAVVAVISSALWEHVSHG